MSLPGRRLAATLGAASNLLWTLVLASPASLPDSTWVALAPIPQQGAAALFGLAVDPSNNQALLAANSAGSLLRSTDGGGKWETVATARAPVDTIAFSPVKAGLALAGTQGAGALVSQDSGATWTAATGLEGRAVRVFGFALTMVVAGTDHGVFVSPDGSTWTQAGLDGSSIAALAVEAIHEPVRLVAGADSPITGQTLGLFQSLDGAQTWTPFAPAISGAYVTRLTAGPLPPSGDIRPLIAGTTAGLFESNDNGASFTPLSGGELLPSTDYTQVVFITDHFDRFYAASDGGGSGSSGGLWRTDDGGGTFRSLFAPVPSVTALAVSNDESPILYVATFDAEDHQARLWAFHDTGAQPQPPIETPTPARSQPPTPNTAPTPAWARLITSPQFPYLVLGSLALVVLLLAAIAHLRGSRH